MVAAESILAVVFGVALVLAWPLWWLGSLVYAGVQGLRGKSPPSSRRGIDQDSEGL